MFGGPDAGVASPSARHQLGSVEGAELPCERFHGSVRLGRRPSAGSMGSVLVKMLRRALVALGIAGAIAAVLRVRGSGGTPPQDGGWRELVDGDQP